MPMSARGTCLREECCACDLLIVSWECCACDHLHLTSFREWRKNGGMCKAHRETIWALLSVALSGSISFASLLLFDCSHRCLVHTCIVLWLCSTSFARSLSLTFRCSIGVMFICLIVIVRLFSPSSGPHLHFHCSRRRLFSPSSGRLFSPSSGHLVVTTTRLTNKRSIVRLFSPVDCVRVRLFSPSIVLAVVWSLGRNNNKTYKQTFQRALWRTKNTALFVAPMWLP